MLFDYLNVLVFFAVGVLFVFANLLLASIVRPSRKTSEGLETYECGEETIGGAWVQFDIRYYTVALVYVVFAVEIAFLFPWAMVLRAAFSDTGPAAGTGVGILALVEGVLFVLILLLGLAYVWAKGDLDWVLSYKAGRYQPKERASRLRLEGRLSIEARQDAALKAEALQAGGGHGTPAPGAEAVKSGA